MAGYQDRTGTQNKKTLEYREKIRAFASKRNYDPIEAMIKMAVSKRKDIGWELRLHCHIQIAKYMVSPLKAVDAETGSSDDVIVSVTLEGPGGEEKDAL